MKLSFRRITSSGGFIPEVDGLRFIAIASVVLYHYWLFLDVKDLNQYSDNIDYSFLTQLLSHGKYGVPLFFIISGFILGMPFAKYHLQSGKPIGIKQYFFRRLTRLEPPYILAMTILLFGSVYVAHTLNWREGIISYFASVFYIHNFIFPGIYPSINNVAWSLEIEVQFYILAPLIASVFAIKSVSARRLVILAVIISFITLNAFVKLPFLSIINFVHYFLTGFLLVDIYLSKTFFLPKTSFDKVIVIVLIVTIWIFDKDDFKNVYVSLGWQILQLTCVFIMYYYILMNKTFKFFSSSLVTNIGGMCYSIYLIHYAIISVAGNKLVTLNFSNLSFVNTTIYCAILTVMIAVACSLFFLLVERPCMDKEWYLKLFRRRKSIAEPPISS